MIVPMIAAAPGDGDFSYQLPALSLTAYRLIIGAGDAAIVLPHDASIPELEVIRKKLQAIVDDPKTYGIDLPWLPIAGVNEGPTYSKGSPQYDLIDGLFAQALAARTSSAEPDAPTGVIPRKVLDNPFAGLGLKLPAWVAPTITISAAAGLGLWIYLTFLKPVSHVVHQNPRRRRRARRHA